MTEIDIAQRLEKLERDNRRLKRFAVAILVLATAFATIYATRQVPDVIKAHEFDAVDSSGKVRVRIGTKGFVNGPGIELYDSQAELRAEISSGLGGPQIATYGTDGTTQARLGVTSKNSPIMWLRCGKGCFEGQRVPPQLALEIDPFSGEPSVALVDAHDFQLHLGSDLASVLAADKTKQLSAASIVMFDKEHHVIWRAP